MEHRCYDGCHHGKSNSHNNLYSNGNRYERLHENGNRNGYGTTIAKCCCICYTTNDLRGSKQRGYGHWRRHLFVEYRRYDSLYHGQPNRYHYLHGNSNGRQWLYQNSHGHGNGESIAECYSERIACYDL